MKAIALVLLAAALFGCVNQRPQTDGDAVRNLPRQRLGAANTGQDVPLTREEARLLRQEQERERFLNAR